MVVCNNTSYSGALRTEQLGFFLTAFPGTPYEFYEQTIVTIGLDIRRGRNSILPSFLLS